MDVLVQLMRTDNSDGKSCNPTLLKKFERQIFPKVMKIGIYKQNFFESVGTRDT